MVFLGVCLEVQKLFGRNDDDGFFLLLFPFGLFQYPISCTWHMFLDPSLSFVLFSVSLVFFLWVFGDDTHSVLVSFSVFFSPFVSSWIEGFHDDWIR